MNGAKYLVVLSSARDGSNTNFLAAAVARGISAAGGVVETVDISRLNIKGCTGCGACVPKNGNGGGDCVQQDDMQGLYPKIVAAQGIVFTSPIYWFNMNGQLKTFLDRCFAVAMKGAFTGKSLAAAFVYGDKDPLVSGCVNAVRSFQDIAAYTRAKWAGCVYGSANETREIEGQEDILKEAEELGRRLVGI